MMMTGTQRTANPLRDPVGSWLALLASMVLTAAVPLTAQENGGGASVQSIEARLVRSGSVNSSLGSPTGVGATVRVGVERPVHLMLGYRFRDGGGSGLLVHCGPELDCRPEPAEWDFDLHSAEIGIGHARLIGETATVRLALSGVWTRISGRFERPPGGPPQDLGSEGQLGLSLMTGAERRFGSLAVFADGRYEDTWCGTGTDGSLPCENYLSLEVGVAYRYGSSP